MFYYCVKRLLYVTRCLSYCTQKLQYEWATLILTPAHTLAPIGIYTCTHAHTFTHISNVQKPRRANTHTYSVWQSLRPFKRTTEKIYERARINEGRYEKNDPYTNTTTTTISVIITIINLVPFDSFFVRLLYVVCLCVRFSFWSYCKGKRWYDYY